MNFENEFNVLAQATSVGHSNIALIKYWGKQRCPWECDPSQHKQQTQDHTTLCQRFQVSCNRPINESISITLDNERLRTHTTILLCEANLFSISGELSDWDKMYLNDRQVNISSRYLRILYLARKFFSQNFSLLHELVVKNRLHFRIYSKNSFPTGVGLASSASGASAFSGALHKLSDKISRKYGSSLKYFLPHPTILARYGSGSGCRSMCDGFVHWKCDSFLENESTPCAISIAGKNHWPNLHILALVFPSPNGTEVSHKEVSSAKGMEISLRTSPLVHHMTSDGSQNPVKEKRIHSLKNAIRQRDFQGLAELTIIESDELHAICHSSNPTIKYLNNFSVFMISLIREYNDIMNDICGSTNQYFAAYSFDAGPNMFIFCEESVICDLWLIISQIFPATDQKNCFLQKYLRETTKFDELHPKVLMFAEKHVLRMRHLFQAQTTVKDALPYLNYLYHSTPGVGVEL